MRDIDPISPFPGCREFRMGTPRQSLEEMSQAIAMAPRTGAKVRD
jgi:hypothetical protein